MASFTRVAAGVWKTARWIIPLAVAFYLWHSGFFAGEKFILSPAAPWAIPLALLCLALNTAAFGLRFHLLLRCLDAPSCLREQWKLHFAGLLPQQIGSEAAFEAMRLISTQTMGLSGPDTLASILMDRLLGVLAMAVLTAAALAVYWQGGDWVWAGLPIPILLGLTALGFAFCRRLTGQALPLCGNTRIRGFAIKFGSALTLFQSRSPRLALLFLLAAAGHICAFAAIYYCAQSLIHTGITLAEAMIGGAVFVFSQALPLPLAGLGVGEAAFGGAVAHLRGAGLLMDFIPVLILNRLLNLSIGLVSWLWLAVSGGFRRE